MKPIQVGLWLCIMDINFKIAEVFKIGHDMAVLDIGKRERDHEFTIKLHAE